MNIINDEQLSPWNSQTKYSFDEYEEQDSSFQPIPEP